MSKRLGELQQGDRVRLIDGVAIITSAHRATWIRHADGSAWDVQWEREDTGAKGWYVGSRDDEVEVCDE